MESTLERARRLQVNATSPKLLVTATADGAGRIRVRFADNGVTGHSEETLGAEITFAVRGAFSGYRKGLTSILGVDPMAETDPSLPHDHPAAKSRRAFARAARDISVQSTSPRRVVQLRWRGVDRIDFRVRPGCLDRLDRPESDLAGEVDAVIAETIEKRGQAAWRLYARIHPTPKER